MQRINRLAIKKVRALTHKTLAGLISNRTEPLIIGPIRFNILSISWIPELAFDS